MVFNNNTLDAISAAAIACTLINENANQTIRKEKTLEEFINTGILYNYISNNNNIIIGLDITEKGIAMLKEVLEKDRSKNFYLIDNSTSSWELYSKMRLADKIVAHRLKGSNIYITAYDNRSLTKLIWMALEASHSERRLPTAIKYIDDVVIKQDRASNYAYNFVEGLKYIDPKIRKTLWAYMTMKPEDGPNYKTFRIATLHYITAIGKGIIRKENLNE